MTKQAVQLDVEAPIEDLCRQKSVFSSIALLVIAVLLLLHTLFSSILGRPSFAVVTLLGVALVLAAVELMWLRTQGRRLTEKAVKIESHAADDRVRRRRRCHHA